MGNDSDTIMTIKDLEDSYNIRVPAKSTVVIRADGKGFSNLLKYHRPYVKSHHDAMITSVIETIKLMSGFVIAYTSSDEATFVISDEFRPETQAWYDFRVLKLNSIVASNMSVYYSTTFTELSKVKTVGIFDARVFQWYRHRVDEIFKSRIFNSINNAVSMVYSAEIGKRNKALSEMENELLLEEIEVPDWFRYGSFIHKQDREFIVLPAKQILPQLEGFIKSIYDKNEKRKTDKK